MLIPNKDSKKVSNSGKLVARGKAKRADYLLYYKPNMPRAGDCHFIYHVIPGGGFRQMLDQPMSLLFYGFNACSHKDISPQDGIIVARRID